MSNTQGNRNAMCPDDNVRCYDKDCATGGCIKQRAAREAVRQKAETQWAQIMARCEKLPDYQQEKIIECGMRLRELACFYGPYFTQALMLTSAEIAAGRLIMPKTANCDNASNLMMPGGLTPEQLKDVKIIVPEGGSKH